MTTKIFATIGIVIVWLTLSALSLQPMIPIDFGNFIWNNGFHLEYMILFFHCAGMATIITVFALGCLINVWDNQ